MYILVINKFFEQRGHLESTTKKGPSSGAGVPLAILRLAVGFCYSVEFDFLGPRYIQCLLRDGAPVAWLLLFTVEAWLLVPTITRLRTPYMCPYCRHEPFI